jgi:L-ornithine N5-oxygenase
MFIHDGIGIGPSNIALEEKQQANLHIHSLFTERRHSFNWHPKQRLQDFINLKTFFPSHHEFSDYFAWAATQFEVRCAYGEDVFEVLPEKRGGEIAMLCVRSRDHAGEVRERLARNLVVSVGGTALVPECFRPFKDDSRSFHSQNYLHGIAANAATRKIAIIGAGQSAAESSEWRLALSDGSSSNINLIFY